MAVDVAVNGKLNTCSCGIRGIEDYLNAFLDGKALAGRNFQLTGNGDCSICLPCAANFTISTEGLVGDIHTDGLCQ